MYICMYIIIISEKESINLTDNREGYMEGFGGRKAKQ